MDSNVLRPMSSTCPMVHCLNHRKSAGRCHGMRPPWPMTRLVAMAAIAFNGRILIRGAVSIAMGGPPGPVLRQSSGAFQTAVKSTSAGALWRVFRVPGRKRFQVTEVQDGRLAVARSRYKGYSGNTTIGLFQKKGCLQWKAPLKKMAETLLKRPQPSKPLPWSPTLAGRSSPIPGRLPSPSQRGPRWPSGPECSWRP